ncbi:MAG: hypothetical protein Kow00121_18970 [Elainellaceae cyanobacterium]
MSQVALIRWNKLLLKTSVWLLSEVLLTMMGTDNIADYGEFVFDMHRIVSVNCVDFVS